MRKSGVLLPISSIPSRYGIGTFSKESYEFVDFLQQAGQKLWQILPLGPTGYGDSPYQSFSTFAGNPYYIDLEEFIEKGLLTEKECREADFGDSSGYVDYEKIFHSRFQLLRKAYERSSILDDKDFCDFVQENSFWLEDYCLYMAIKDSMNGASWITWEENIKLRRKEAMERCKAALAEEIHCYQFQQYFFQKQWNKLKQYANEKGIEIVGDIPIYVALDGADTWANTELFQLDQEGIPTAVAGCPPDAFSATGQLWGNPLYRWYYHKETGYDWWVKRIAHCFKLYDVVRIDHFRGFDEYYAIPWGAETAETGHWEKGPGMGFFHTLEEKLGKRQVIAEDLGFLTESVIQLVENTGYPGMKILQFAFDSREESDYLPHNYVRNSVCYTGTHDNDTTPHWFSALNEHDKNFAKRYMNLEDDNMACWELIRLAHASVADTCIIPLQDYLELGEEARMNVPSTLGTNWKWRLDEGRLTEELAERLKKLTRLYGR